jgi:hypothetical protein
MPATQKTSTSAPSPALLVLSLAANCEAVMLLALQGGAAQHCMAQDCKEFSVHSTARINIHTIAESIERLKYSIKFYRLAEPEPKSLNSFSRWGDTALHVRR